MLANTLEERMNNSYQFTLVLDGVDENTPNLEDVLFEAGCDDALINYKNGTVYLDFDRAGEDLEQSIISAINDVESADVGATIISVAPEHLVSLSDIAQRVSMTRQAVSLLMLGERGAGCFPKPILKIANKSPLWRWSAVAEWFYQQGKITNHDIIDNANVVEDINAVLELRSRKTVKHRRNILDRLEHRVI
jgi:hypothetical protein